MTGKSTAPFLQKTRQVFDAFYYHEGQITQQMFFSRILLKKDPSFDFFAKEGILFKKSWCKMSVRCEIIP